MKSFLCFLVFTICFVTTSLGQDDTQVSLENKGPVIYQKISHKELTAYSFIEEDNTTNVTEFKIHIEGQPSILVKGPTMNGAAIKAIQKAKNKSQVVIFDIVKDGISSEEGAIIFSLED